MKIIGWDSIDNSTSFGMDYRTDEAISGENVGPILSGFLKEGIVLEKIQISGMEETDPTVSTVVTTMEEARKIFAAYPNASLRVSAKFSDPQSGDEKFEVETRLHTMRFSYRVKRVGIFENFGVV